MNPSHLVWLDLETTGLDPRVDVVLEVCAYLAKFDDPFNAALMHKAVLQCRSQNDVHPRVREMHAKNGLWGECIMSALTSEAADTKLMDSIPFAPERGSLVMAGFSVHFDLGFVREHFPKFATFFSHRVYDVSALKLFCRSMGMPESKTPKEEAHRAEEDVLESIAHAIACQEWLEERYSKFRELGV